MKRILFLLLFVCSFASGQIQKLEVIGLDTLTTTERNTITVPGDRVYFIYNETTGQFEYNVKGSGWTTFSGGGISNVVEDLTPQLGGALDGQGNDITGIDDLSADKILFDDAYSGTPSADEWQVFMETTSDALYFTQNGVTTNRFQLDFDGGASNDRSLITKAYADANYAGGISNIVEDTTPQLGGDLASNGFNYLLAANDEIVFNSALTMVNNGTNNYLDVASGNLTLRDEADAFSQDFTFNFTSNSLQIGASGTGQSLYRYGKLSATDTEPTALEGAYYADDSENRPKYYDGTSWKAFLLDGDVSAGSGDVVGPASATDNAIARFDTTTGKLLQNSGVTIDDSGNISTSGTVNGVTMSNVVTGPVSALNNAIPTFNGTTGKIIKNSPLLLWDGATLEVNTSSVSGVATLGRTSADWSVYIDAPQTTGNYRGMFGAGETTSAINAGFAAFDDGISAALGLSFFTGNNAGISEVLKMDSSQNVSIPNGNLSVTGNITVTGTVDGVDLSALTGTDVALTDSGAYFTTDNVEAATQELAADVAGKVDGTIPTRTSVTAVTEIGTQTMANYLSDGVPSAGQWVGISDATPEYLTTSATFNFALLDEYNYDDSATDAATITFSNMGEGHKVRIKYNRASAPTYSGETPTQLPNTFSAGSWPANDDVEAVYYKRFGTVYYFFKEL